MHKLFAAQVLRRNKMIKRNRARSTGFAVLRSRKRKWLIAAALILALSGLAYATYIQSFELDAAGWSGATRVMSGTRGVTSKTGAFHAEDGGGAFTRWGGY